MTGPARVALVPGVLALLPEHAGLDDPVAALRAACHAAVGWLGRDVTVLADPQGARVAAHLLGAVGREGDAPSYLVVANGSARRSEKAPGHLDGRAAGFDAALGAGLRAGSFEVDADLAAELWASVEGLVLAGRELGGCRLAGVDYDDDPFGVQYWVMRWTCES
ncbi:hypothetical protein [Nocardioides sp. SYSU D00038]|uniref:hypothetical protein n=1 Tax=Nocardioides sp. SYSU D00038 TaxID=2812554 RepID=UPI001966EC78|nr:hypothetical protein [Nocardioides sp. SYSU D00038]